MIRKLYNCLIKIYINVKYFSKKSYTKSMNVSKDIVMGFHSRIGKKAIILSNVSIGDFSYINTQFGETFIDSNVKIGKYSSIGPNVCIGLGNHNPSYVTTHPILYDIKYGFVKKSINKIDDTKETVIGNDVWIGANSNIKRGVIIGNGVIIGMNSVVTKNVPDYAIVAGNPAKIIRYRFESEEIDFLNKSEWWNLHQKQIKESINEFYDINKFIK